MSDTLYGKGITVASGFDLGAKSPLDSRIVASTVEERDAHVINNRAYDGMIVYVVEDKTTYQYLNGEWVIFGAEVIDNLASDSTIKGLSANQGRVLNEKIMEVELKIGNSGTSLEEVEKEINTLSESVDSRFISVNNQLSDINEQLNDVSEQIETVQDGVNNNFTSVNEQLNNINEQLSDINEQMESVKDGIDYNDLLNKPNIPTRVGQLTNDANYVTKDYVDRKLAEYGGSGGGENSQGGTGAYIGETAPENTHLIWVDSTTPYNLDPDTYEGRLKLNYISMVNRVYFKLIVIQANVSKLEEKINEISVDNASDAGACRTELARQRSRMSILEAQIMDILTLLNSDMDLISLKERCKQVKADIKSIRYALADLGDKTMRILDQEKGIVIPDNENGDNDGGNVAVDGYALLAETGVAILTEDGSVILLEGVTTEEVLKDAILNELGVAILTEDGRVLLKG